MGQTGIWLRTKSRQMKRRNISVACSVCLLLIALSGYYIYSRYCVQIDSKKELLVSYVKPIDVQIDYIKSLVNELPVIVKPSAETKRMLNSNMEMDAANILQLENFYSKNYYFIKGISIQDNLGNAFNITRDKDGNYIKDTYKRRLLKPLVATKEVTVNQSNFSSALPIFYKDSLVGNIEVDFDIASLDEAIYSPYVQKDIWPTAIIDANNYTVFPNDALIRLDQVDIIWSQIQQGNSGYMTHYVSGDGFSHKVLSYYKPVMIEQYVLGEIISINIDPDRISAITEFILLCCIFIILMVIAIIIANKITNERNKRLIEKDKNLDFLQTVFQKIPVGIVVTDAHDQLINANQYAFEALNYYITTNDIGKNIRQISLPTDFTDTTGESNEIIKCNIGYHGKDLYINKQQINVTNLSNDKFTINSFWDITKLEQERQKAVQSDIAKSELLSRITNDLKKPLERIEDTVILLNQKYPEDQDVSHVKESAAAFSDMMETVIDFADIESGQVVLDEIVFNVQEVAKHTMAMYKIEADRKGVKLYMNITNKERQMVGDPIRYSQILDQLLSNAVRFTSVGEIRISIEPSEMLGKKILVKTIIEDTGQGMSKQQLKNLFQLEFQSKSKDTSIGLGVIIAKKLVSMMGGTIRASSPSPISNNPSFPGSQFSFTMQCLPDVEVKKNLDFSHITSYVQINVLIISSDIHSIQGINASLNMKGINTDLYMYNSETEDLLINKLTIDKEYYQLVIVNTSDNSTNFLILNRIYENKLSGSFLIALIDRFYIKGDYLKAKNLEVDCYLQRTENRHEINHFLKEHFKNIVEQDIQKPTLRKGLSVLIAENNLLSQSVAKLAFNKLGYTVDLVTNEIELNEQLESKDYDIMLIDLQFPPDNGFTTVKGLRNKGYKQPIIAMTSTQTKENFKNMAEAGMNGFVVKPLIAENIKDMLLQWFV